MIWRCAITRRDETSSCRGSWTGSLNDDGAEVVNLTPHEVVVLDEEGTVLARLPSSGVARAAVTVTPAGTIAGLPAVQISFGGPVALPEWRPGVYLLVSRTTAEAAKASGRTVDDLVGTTELVRDAAGRAVGCRALTCNKS